MLVLIKVEQTDTTKYSILGLHFMALDLDRALAFVS